MANKESLDKMLSEQKSKVASLEGDLETLSSEKEELSEKYSELNTQVTQLQKDYKETQADYEAAKTVMAEKDKKITSMDQALKAAFADISNMNVTPKGGRMMVAMEEPILFRSGSISLQKKYRDQVASLAEMLKANPNLRIQVEGHTDAKQMVQGARYQSNWDLSTARALSVVRELAKNGVAETQLAAVGKGEFDPATTEEGKEAQAMNRRVEIILIPAMDELYKMSKEGV